MNEMVQGENSTSMNDIDRRSELYNWITIAHVNLINFVLWGKQKIRRLVLHHAFDAFFIIIGYSAS